MADGKEIEKKDAQNAVENKPASEKRVYVPQTDIYEKQDSLVLIADMPGVDEKNVDIDLEENTLTITGRVTAPEVKGNRVLAEYETGDYQRSFTLSNEVDTRNIDASIKDGVLRLILPKSEESQPKKIEVKAG